MIDKIMELRAQSLPIAEIARRCGLTVGQVKYQLKKSKRYSMGTSIQADAKGTTSQQKEQSNTYPWKLPSFYGDNMIKLIPQGPTVLFAYWEITWSRMRMVATYLQTDYRMIRKGIRLYDVTDRYFNGANAHTYRDIFVQEEGASSWYIHDCQPGRTYIADFGLFHEGRFCPILRSEPIVTPRDRQAPWGDSLVSSAATSEYPAWFENFSSYTVYSK
ncbi:DUF4912 domain-containing protein [Brevibacillus ginsengisoli]|uniref:DUF4912 domain-containing protein n=1 Tax=Brevibacillus ginsengisoli TaxID=363854 RepID=UPI003CF695C7